jgi:rubrerythrin
MGELLALAGAMEQEAIDGYIALGRRMNDMARPDLAAVFDSLVAEERTHLGKVDDWRIALGQSAARVPVFVPEESFDDEGAGIVAPALLSAYRAFSMAVRNEERAFVFWTYVSAHANSDEISQAAERMAREELGHVSKLRHERRKAFHQERSKALVVSGDDLPLLEKRLSRDLRTIAVQSGANDGARLQVLAHEADLRAEALAAQAFGTTPNPGRPPQAGLENALPICEFLVDCYLDLGDRSISEQDADRARSFAAQIIHCLRLVRGIASRAQLEGSRPN